MLSKTGVFLVQDSRGSYYLVGDEALEVFGSYPLFNRLRPILIKQLGAHTGAKLLLSQIVAVFIDRWDELDRRSREEILRKLE